MGGEVIEDTMVVTSSASGSLSAKSVDYNIKKKKKKTGMD